MRLHYLLPTLVVLAGLAASPAAGGVRLEVHFVGGAGCKPDLGTVKVLAAGIDTANPGGVQALSQVVPIPGRASFGLPGDGIFRIELDSQRYWSGVEIVAVKGETSVDIPIFPTVMVKGKLLMPRGSTPPKSITARCQSPPGASGKIRTSSQVCSASDATWSCRLPAETLDLRLHAKGFISAYHWALHLAPGADVRLSPWTLRPGASLVGRVETADGRPLDEGCRINLAPYPAGGNRAGVRSRLQELSMRPGERGFFQFSDLRVGHYVLSAEQKGYARTEMFPITVQPDSEIELLSPLVLARPLELSVEIDPPLSPSGHAWLARLLRPRARPGSVDAIGEIAVTEEGTGRRAGLAPGGYILEVEEPASGSRFAWHEFDLEPGSQLLHLDLPVVRVRGDVRLGDKPLKATLHFGGRSGRESVEMSSALAGTFEGCLPRAGSWTVDVDSEEPAVRRTLRNVSVEDVGPTEVARVDLRLPDTKLTGEVVDEAGAEASNAVVGYRNDSSSESDYVQADKHGHFAVEGLSPGTLTLMAEWRDETSAPANTLLGESHPAEARLVVRAMRTVRGLIRGFEGPLPGVSMFPLPRDTANRVIAIGASRTVTDIQGHFQIQVPRDTAILDLTLMAPGVAMQAIRVAPIPTDPLQLSLEVSDSTLRLALPKDAVAFDPGAPQPVLFSGPIAIDRLLLDDWQRQNAETSRAGELVVSHLPPGDYSACLLSPPDVAAVLLGAATVSGSSCRQVLLSPHEDSTITLP